MEFLQLIGEAGGVGLGQDGAGQAGAGVQPGFLQIGGALIEAPPQLGGVGLGAQQILLHLVLPAALDVQRGGQFVTQGIGPFEGDLRRAVCRVHRLDHLPETLLLEASLLEVAPHLGARGRKGIDLILKRLGPAFPGRALGFQSSSMGLPLGVPFMADGRGQGIGHGHHQGFRMGYNRS